ncbi:MAG: zinc-ribbon domain-containing protein [Evtepia gabavorous]
MRESLYDYCTRTRRQALLEEWDVEGNGALTPLALSHGSRQKVWWRCGAGHRWQAAVYTRTGAESGCPYCAGKRPWPGFNDLASQEPALAAQWHPERNGPLTPDQVVCGSTRRVWWQCGSGHVWAASVKSRAAGAGCPYCTGRRISPGENDLATLYPALARQWHPTKNGGLTPAAVAPGSRRRVWWQCPQGHTWQAAVFSRSQGADCPVCTGRTVLPGENDLATVFPQLARQWDQERNGALTPQQVSPYSNRAAWWRCAWGTAGTRPSAPGPGGRLPYCAGRKVLAGFNDLATRYPELAQTWTLS